MAAASASYESLHGDEALAMHGKHLIRVPTIRPLLEDDWFVRQIEGARRRVLEEDCGETENGKLLHMALSTDEQTLILSNRNLSDSDFHRGIQLPPNLRGIDLSRNSLKTVPAAIVARPALTALISLNISRNALRGLPPEIRLLTNLAKLIAVSNHLRMRQLPLDALASLERLELLDLRYNRKLKQAALTALNEALLPRDSRLEVRCTVPPLTASQRNTSNDRDSQEKKLSACDRDATMLQSQLEPLSTPQLRKRLERSFGVLLDEGTEQAYDREFVMKTLLQCYENRGVRKVRYEKGAPAATATLAALLARLEAVPWPRTTRERPKIRAEYYMILQKPGSGAPNSAKTKKETAKLMKYKCLFDLAVNAMAEVDLEFSRRFTALAVTKNFVGSPHIDTLNVGPFYGLSLGEFSGGGSIAVECSPFLVAEIETRGRFGKVDGRFPHWVTPYEGTRYSLIYYVTSGIVEPQTTAIFAPLSCSNQELDSWIPPPVFVP